MKKKLYLFPVLTSIVILLSCKKEKFCGGCDNANKPPVANAGADVTIVLPDNAATLDGSGSNDPDGNIATYQWSKILGPASFNIINATAVRTEVTSLAEGIYYFELKATDNKGLSAKDTVMIKVNATGANNHAPVAKAGPDQAIVSPTNTITLDGSGSTDPDNNIVSYQWTKVVGPSLFDYKTNWCTD